jgi:hypothetical protein
MKEEKEVHYLKSIYLSDFTSGILKVSHAGTKSDFERICGVGENNMEFRKWLDKLIKEGVLVQKGVSENKYPVWTANTNMILKKLNSISYYTKFKKVEYDDMLRPFSQI